MKKLRPRDTKSIWTAGRTDRTDGINTICPRIERWRDLQLEAESWTERTKPYHDTIAYINQQNNIDSRWLYLHLPRFRYCFLIAVGGGNYPRRRCGSPLIHKYMRTDFTKISLHTAPKHRLTHAPFNFHLSHLQQNPHPISLVIATDRSRAFLIDNQWNLL